MQFVRYEASGRTARVGLFENDEIFDLEAASGGRVSGGDMKAFIGLGKAAADEIVAVARTHSPVPIGAAKLLAPIANPGKLLAVAGGYYTHEGDTPLKPEAIPMLFAKMTDDIKGPGDPITIWKKSPGVVDEIEVAIVIGVGGKDIPREQAMDHVLGYTICNDVSGRELAVPAPGRRDEAMDGFLDWLNGKWMDGFAILGPSIVTKSEAGDLSDIQITSRVSGEVRVQATTKMVNIPWDELISFASSLYMLRPGDIITTGMPHGVHAEVMLKPGDVVEGEIERLGVLRNPVVAEA